MVPRVLWYHGIYVSHDCAIAAPPSSRSILVWWSPNLHAYDPFSIQSCRSRYAPLYLCKRSFYNIFVKFRNSKKNVLKIVLFIVNINKDDK